jgi:kynurenine formamidase
MPEIHYSSILDLSHVVHPDMPRWPGDPPVEFASAAQIDADGFFLRRVSLGEHSGTHLNAPAHFFARGADASAIRPERLVLAGVVIDVRAQAASDPDFALGSADVAAWEARNGPVPSGCMVMLCTGWGERWADPPRFFNAGADGRLHFPGFGLPAAQLLLEERGAAGLGTDAHGIEPGLDEDFSVNCWALAREALVLENLANLEHLPPRGTTLSIGLLRLEGGSGAPAAVLAFVP